MPNPIFWENYFKMSSFEIFISMLSVKLAGPEKEIILIIRCFKQIID